MRFTLLYITTTIFLFLAVGCDGKDEIVPSYIHIPETAVAESSTFGSNSQNVEYVWLYADDQQIGVFELPATVPVLVEGDAKITLRAGVKANGSTYNLQQYPFYSFYSETINFEATIVDTIRPLFTYRNETRVLLNNDFEENDNFEVKFEEFATFARTNIGENVFEGNYSGCMSLFGNEVDTLNTNILVGTISSFDLNRDNYYYVEFDYQNNTEFEFFVAGKDGDGVRIDEGTLTIFKTEDWSKLYINLTPTADIAEGGSGIQLVFRSVLPDTLANGKVCLDNIKLLEIPKI